MYIPNNLVRGSTIAFLRFITRSLWRHCFFIGASALALGWFALSPPARAVTPAPDGGYPNGNTAEGENALYQVSTGRNNVAVGFEGSILTRLAAPTRLSVLARF